jgi:hypothetical protein
LWCGGGGFGGNGGSVCGGSVGGGGCGVGLVAVVLAAEPAVVVVLGFVVAMVAMFTTTVVITSHLSKCKCNKENFVSLKVLLSSRRRILKPSNIRLHLNNKHSVKISKKYK